MSTQSTNKKILQLIKLLENEEYSKSEILEKAKIKSSTFHKYTNLCKKAGFALNKKFNKYKIKRYQDELFLADFELSILAYLQSMTYIMLPRRKKKEFKNAVLKMLHLTDKKSNEEVKNKFNLFKKASLVSYYHTKITALDKYINNNKNIEILTTSKKIIKLIPKSFNWEKDKPYLLYNDTGEQTIKSICIDNIAKIMETNQKTFFANEKETIFELYGNLAKSYLLKDEERIVDNKKDKLIIANATSDKKTLFKRLLRYDILCKIVFPKSDVEEFKKLISKSLSNLENI